MTFEKQLSFCVITRNDEKYISDCLRDMKDIADEMIVADLGSCDRTAALARQLGAAVYPVEWEDDFSRVMNFCMEKASGRWVLFLQPDEMMEEEQRKKLRRLLDNPNAEAFLFYIAYHPEERGISSPAQMLRLFRNRKEYRFQYRSFAYIPDEILTGIADSGLQISFRDECTARGLQSCVSLLEKEAGENPEDAYLQYLYGIELLNAGKYEESLPHLEKARETVNWGYLYSPHLYKCLGWVYLYLERSAQARGVLDEGLENFAFYTDLFILRAELHRQLGAYKEEEQDLLSCLQILQQSDPAVPRPEIEAAVAEGMLDELENSIK